MNLSRLLLLPLCVVLGATPSFAGALSPANWPLKERQTLELLEQRTRPESTRIVEGGEGFVAGTLSPISVRVGVETLKQGGTAADAATAVALTQITTSLGSVVSYAGIAQILYFDAASGNVHSIDAGWASYLDETDPNTIPPPNETRQPGRKTLVPGFMAGIEAMQQRFGALRFGELFEPAIWYAENGVTISRTLSHFFKVREKELSRTESGRRFLAGGGRVQRPPIGSTFLQPELAETLKAIAREGAQHMYRGAWAQHYVEAVRSEGGKVTREDMERYQPIWQEALSTTFAGHTVYGPGRSAEGGYQALAALNLIEELKIERMPPYWRDADSFRRLSRVLNVTDVLPGWMLERARAKGVELALTDRASKPFAAALAPLVDTFFAAPATTAASPHTAGVVVVDRHGNMAVIVHSINTVLWGTTGIVVGGIPVADSAAISQDALSSIKSGDRISDSMAPMIALRDGVPAAGVAITGYAHRREAVRILVGLLGYRAELKEMMTAPPLIVRNGQAKVEFAIAEKGYPRDFFDRLRSDGVSFELIPEKEVSDMRGTGVFGAFDATTKRWRSVEVPHLFAFSAAY